MTPTEMPPLLTLFCTQCNARCFLHGVPIDAALNGGKKFHKALLESGQFVECFHFVAKHDGHKMATHVLPYEAKA